MILTIFDHEKTSTIQVPVTPSSTFVDVLRCCKGYSDEKYYLTGVFSNKEERVIETHETPYEFVRRNENFKRQFVVYKSEPDNIFLRGSHGHQEAKKRFTLSDLANFVSHHDRVVERQNKAINAMEERLKRLRKEEMVRRRGETNLLTVKQSAHVYDRKIDLIRQQRGHPQVQRSHGGQGTSLEEMKVWFREMDEEMERLKRRAEGSLQRILTTFEVSDLMEYKSNQELQKSYGFNENATTRVESKYLQKSGELDLKIKDLRSRLNLNKKHAMPVQVPRVNSGLQNDSRPKSATEILMKSGRSSSRPYSVLLPSSTSKSSNVISQDETFGTSSQRSQVGDHAAHVFPDSSSSSSSSSSSALTGKTERYTATPPTNTTECRQANAASEATSRNLTTSVSANHVSNLSIKFRQTPSDAISSSSSWLPSLSQRRRQRSAFHFQSQDALPSSSSSLSSSSMVSSSAVSSSTSGPNDDQKCSSSKIFPPIPAKPKSCFLKVIQKTENIDNIAANLNGRSHASDNLELLPLHSKMIDTTNSIIGDNHSNEQMAKHTEDIVSSGSSASNNGTTTTILEEVDIMNATNIDDRSIISTDLQTPISIPASQQSVHKDSSPTSSPYAFIGSSPLVEVTPMSTNSDDLRERDCDIFNISVNQSVDDLCDEESYAIQNGLKSSNNLDIDGDRHQETRNDSFFSIPEPSKISAPEIFHEPSASRSENDSFSDSKAVESFTASPYPYPLTSVLEQLDGSASILRHSAGGVRSLRNRLSSEDSHHHGDASHSTVEAGSLSFDEDDVLKSGLHDGFKPKQLPATFFNDFPLEDVITLSVADVSVDSEKKASNLDEVEILHRDDDDDKCKDFKQDPVILPDILCTGKSGDEKLECVSNISFKDGHGKDNEIIIISLKEDQDVSDVDDNEPGIIIMGTDAKANTEESSSDDDDVSTSASDVEEDDEDGSGSFSPLIDTFREDFEDELDNVAPSAYEEVTPIEEEKEMCAPPVLVLESGIVVKSILKRPGTTGMRKGSPRVVFNPLAILLDAALQGELDVVKDIINKHGHENMANDEGITALHNAICAGHSDIVHFLVTSGCDINAADSDLWTPLHCAASCYNVGLVKFLVENGACVFATTESEGETALDKCEDEEEDGGRCRRYLEEIQSRMMQIGAEVYAAYDSQSTGSDDELHFFEGDVIVICEETKSSDDGDGSGVGRNWCFGRNKKTGDEGYVPKNYLSLFPRVIID